MNGCLSAALIHALFLEATKTTNINHKPSLPTPQGVFMGPFLGLHAVLPQIPLSPSARIRGDAVFLLCTLC